MLLLISLQEVACSPCPYHMMLITAIIVTNEGNDFDRGRESERVVMMQLLIDLRLYTLL